MKSLPQVFKWLIPIAVGLAIWLIPHADTIDDKAWTVLAVFVATIIGFLLRPLRMGPITLIALVFLASVGAISYKESLVGFADSTVWLVLAAFILAGTVNRTLLGQRIALWLIKTLGKSMMGLSYAICSSELLLAPFVPSNTARGGGIMAPIVNSIANSLGSFPNSKPKLAGSYLTFLGAQANLVAASMFMTGMAANPIVSEAASDIFGIDFGWGTWLLGSIVPGLLSMFLLPQLIFRIEKPELVDVASARANASRQLEEMGPWTNDQRGLAVIFVLMLILWTTKPLHGLGTGLVALMGVAILLISGIEKYEDTLDNHGAWDSLLWLGGLLTMAKFLLDKGIIAHFADFIQLSIQGLPILALCLAMGLIYFYSMYGFSMLSGHIAAFIFAFFAVALAADAPPLLIVPILAYFSCLCGCTTNYSSGPIIIYFGLGYVQPGRWFRNGFVVSVFHVVVWLGAGLVWWKILGWY